MALLPPDPARGDNPARSLAFRAALRLRDPLTALQALTGRGQGEIEPALNEAAIYFPLIGLLFGAVWVGADRLAYPAGRLPASFLVLLAATLTTRGRPLVALGRVVVAAFSPARTAALAILSAPANVPVYAAATLLAALELACLIELDRFRTVGLLFAPLLGRCSMVVLAVGSRAATAEGRRIKFAPGLRFNEFALATTLTFAFIAIATEFLGLLLVLGTATLSILLRVFFHRWIDGVNRTTVQAACEATQIMTLALLASFS